MEWMSRGAVLGLYRSLLRAASAVPTENQRSLALHRIRDGFRKSKDINDEGQLRHLVMMGHTNLETLRIQSAHLKGVLTEDHDSVMDTMNTAQEAALEPTSGSDERADEKKKKSDTSCLQVVTFILVPSALHHENI
eukprot:CAMPEP_0181301318 /NCGR_PEP_ID=MMETSP1101-20121128/7357_1 /TAXON_ID=46948 /ORGANISM="Rhodomonas abbreviata, Strain Caron Lab Isolate" /LENGTH=135 /DNA_ID=CAMNT_0023406609 /DNA_START=25 /DNA_END=433 /DNA_ORIENTATION=-